MEAALADLTGYAALILEAIAVLVVFGGGPTIAVIRTFLNDFLEKDLERAERTAEAAG